LTDLFGSVLCTTLPDPLRLFFLCSLNRLGRLSNVVLPPRTAPFACWVAVTLLDSSPLFSWSFSPVGFFFLFFPAVSLFFSGRHLVLLFWLGNAVPLFSLFCSELRLFFSFWGFFLFFAPFAVVAFLSCLLRWFISSGFRSSRRLDSLTRGGWHHLLPLFAFFSAFRRALLRPLSLVFPDRPVRRFFLFLNGGDLFFV